MTSNLEQHRGGPSVWDRASRMKSWDRERWIVALAAGGCLVSGFRYRRSVRGTLLLAGGAVLAWWAADDLDTRRRRRGRLILAWSRQRDHEDDQVSESSEESFPASDAPSWTPTTAAIGPERRPPRNSDG